MYRSLYDSNSNDRRTGRNQINSNSAFIDASMVYGTNSALAASLRDPSNPSKLMVGDGNLLPEGIDVMFLAGDERANEQIGLTAMHTLFVREHNRLVDKFSIDNPNIASDDMYQIVRKIIGAKVQVITYKEFLPKLLGPSAIPTYRGYKARINPGISNEFATAAYRFGHSLLSSHILTINMTSSGNITRLIPLRDAFFDNTLFKDVGIDAILIGLASQPCQEMDTKLVDDIRNFLFGPPGAGGMDLGAINIQRGRDHGLSDYNSIREAYDLTHKTAYNQITNDANLQYTLGTVYGHGCMHNLDLYVAGLSETHINGGMLGETFYEICVDQFSRLRDGDRFWYQNDPFFDNDNGSGSSRYNIDISLSDIEDTTLSQVIRDNTDIIDIADDVFTI